MTHNLTLPFSLLGTSSYICFRTDSRTFKFFWRSSGFVAVARSHLSVRWSARHSILSPFMLVGPPTSSSPIFVDTNRCSLALLSGSMLLSHPILALFFAHPRAFPLKCTLYEQNSTRFAFRRSV